jgi:hypothetical protein
MHISFYENQSERSCGRDPRRAWSEPAGVGLAFSRAGLAGGIAGVAGRLSFGFKGDVIGCPLRDLGVAGGRFGRRRSLVLGPFFGVARNAGQARRVAFRESRLASNSNRPSRSLAPSEGRVVRCGRPALEISLVPPSSHLRRRSADRRN